VSNVAENSWKWVKQSKKLMTTTITDELRFAKQTSDLKWCVANKGRGAFACLVI